MGNNIIVSGSPHVQTEQTTKSMMYHVVIALMPALLLSFYVFGLGAIIVSIVSIVFCIGFEYLIQKFILKVPTTISDGSALLTGVLLALNLPAGFPVWMIIIGALIAIGVAKLSFGGLGNNIFNPALVARVFLLISFPVQMTKWPEAFADRMKLADATTGATPLGFLKEALRGEGSDIRELMKSLPDYTDMFIGFIGGSIGEISAVLLLLGGLYLIWKKIITWHIPVSVLLTVAAFSAVMWLVDPTQYADPLFHLITGGLMLGAFYMATDLVTSPMSPKGQILFGIGIGLLTMLIRYFGAYPEGVSFAILIMNAFVPLIDRFLKVKKFGV
ncbi:MAG TPA: Na+-transporting NADH:ubiquinone oxidoreductase subunit D [Saprospirales bacterium]|nr:Na+-transporting NADH:ubiquinone oxidoreductase subunit D [Saprospirales bacterium]HAY70580.1 Na+-transporting NADH:ubiquinone oxidoreductase subunit D [Saprospirales bacterium]HRQ29515.1 RnfABCDGE type electron transport complex subunit D [Saprospiraceae bacterium]